MQNFRGRRALVLHSYRFQHNILHPAAILTLFAGANGSQQTESTINESSGDLLVQHGMHTAICIPPHLPRCLYHVPLNFRPARPSWVCWDECHDGSSESAL